MPLKNQKLFNPTETRHISPASACTEGVTYGTGALERVALAPKESPIAPEALGGGFCTEGVTNGTESMEEGSVCIKEVAHSHYPSLS